MRIKTSSSTTRTVGTRLDWRDPDALPTAAVLPFMVMAALVRGFTIRNTASAPLVPPEPRGNLGGRFAFVRPSVPRSSGRFRVLPDLCRTGRWHDSHRWALLEGL